MRLTRITLTEMDFRVFVCLPEQVPDASISVESPSLEVKKPKKGLGFGGMFKKPSGKAGLKVSTVVSARLL